MNPDTPMNPDTKVVLHPQVGDVVFVFPRKNTNKVEQLDFGVVKEVTTVDPENHIIEVLLDRITLDSDGNSACCTRRWRGHAGYLFCNLHQGLWGGPVDLFEGEWRDPEGDSGWYQFI